ncbi:MAG: hypothetical protein HRU19_11540 [Pseudobacteriovorax sp.]|nr:hypothetical protein [Pseudobacteriovorax sp.]
MTQPQPKILVYADADRQIKKTLPLIENVRKAPSDIESFLAVGQHFNGLIGTFAFIEDDEIASCLKELAELIDNTCLMYKSEEIDAVTDVHFSFVETATNISLAILDSFVVNGSITEEVAQSYSACVQQYAQMSDIKEKENLDQDDIDNLLDNL